MRYPSRAVAVTRPVRAAILSVAILLLLAGCGIGARMSPSAFQDRAREVVDRWHGSPADRAWREGLVPLEGLDTGSQWRRMPGWVNVSDHNGVWVLDTDLPVDTPPSRRLRWPDGSILTVPLVTAGAAYAELSRPADFIEEDCPSEGCRKLRVTAAELVDVPLRTSRGTVQVPAWRFTVKGVRGRFSRVAIHPSAISRRPAPRKGEYEEVMGFDLVPGKNRELLLHYGHGTCDRIHGARAYETGDVVVVDVDEEHSGRACNAMLVRASITVMLNEPLGERLVLDSGSGLPVLHGESPPGR